MAYSHQLSEKFHWARSPSTCGLLRWLFQHSTRNRWVIIAQLPDLRQNCLRRTRMKIGKVLIWLAIAAAGALALATIAFHRREPINAMWLVVAALCSYALGYRFYSKFVAAKVLALDAMRATPAERLENGRDFVRTNKWVVFGHHFAAIAGPGPLVGPVLAAQFGYLPGTLWILVGAVF